MPRRAVPWQERIRAFFVEGEPDECWPWLGALKDGYGFVRLGGRASPKVTAHRAVFMLLVGPIPAGAQLDHQCHNRDAGCAGGSSCAHRACVNPAHVEPATSAQNTLRGRAPSAVNARRVHCPKGHPYDVVYTTGGRSYRSCRTCKAAHARRYYASR